MMSTYNKMSHMIPPCRELGVGIVVKTEKSLLRDPAHLYFSAKKTIKIASIDNTN